MKSLIHLIVHGTWEAIFEEKFWYFVLHLINPGDSFRYLLDIYIKKLGLLIRFWILDYPSDRIYGLRATVWCPI
jgi:hypothetical protein